MQEPSNTQRGGYWMPATVLVVGLASLVMLATVNWIQQILIQGNYTMVRMAGEVQTRCSIAHLWVEEMVEGDHVDRDEIANHLDESAEILAVIKRTEKEDNSVKFLSGDETDETHETKQTTTQNRRTDERPPASLGELRL